MWPFNRKKKQIDRTSNEGLQFEDWEFANAVLHIARHIDSCFRASRGAPPTESVARQEIAIFALVFCEIAAHFGLQEKALADRVFPKVLGFAIHKLVDEKYATNFDTLSKAYQIRSKELSFDIEYEIFDRWNNNKTGGPHFSFARLFSKAYQVHPVEAPLFEFATNLSVWLTPILVKGEQLKQSFKTVENT